MSPQAQPPSRFIGFAPVSRLLAKPPTRLIYIRDEQFRKFAMSDLRPLLGRVAAGHCLSEAEAEEAFEIIMSGDATPSQMGGLLMGMRVRGETVDEIAGAARIMRSKALAIDAPPGTIDTVGTGGDASGSFNISTATGLVVAGAGVPVAKHGNRAFSSKSGAADVLTALGVNIDCDMAIVQR